MSLASATLAPAQERWIRVARVALFLTLGLILPLGLLYRPLVVLPPLLLAYVWSLWGLHGYWRKGLALAGATGFGAFVLALLLIIASASGTMGLRRENWLGFAYVWAFAITQALLVASAGAAYSSTGLEKGDSRRLAAGLGKALLVAVLVVVTAAIEVSATHRARAERAQSEAERLYRQHTRTSVKQALDKFDEAFTHWRAIGDGEQVGTLVDMGVACSCAGAEDRAAAAFGEALRLSRGEGPDGDEAATSAQIARAYAVAWKGHKAMVYLNRARALRPSRHWHWEHATMTFRWAIDFIESAKRSLDSGAKEDGRRAIRHAIFWCNQGILALQPEKKTENERLRHDAEMLEQQLENLITHAYSQLGEYDKALSRSGEILARMRAAGNRSGEADALEAMGRVYAEMGQPPKALDHYNQALAIYRKIGERGSEAGVLEEIGGFFEKRAQPRKALEYYNRALPLWAEEDYEREADLLEKIGKVYEALGQKQKAQEARQRATALKNRYR